MNIWLTEIKAIHPHTGDMLTWGGDNIEAPTWKLAQQWCDENRGYLKVVGQLVSEIPCKEGTFEADWDNMTDYENASNN